MKDNKVFLRHILERIGRVELYIRDADWENFQSDIKTVDAVVRNIEVIGEAATDMSGEFREQTKQIKWRKIIDTRNRIIHGYASVDLEIIWDISQNDLPVLKKQIEEILKDLT
ncbi:MAG: DUF86 domain-containing protein [Blastocatellia bacterium]|nr:DUF86 domain-containing protein [Blastocatellia bacterium]